MISDDSDMDLAKRKKLVGLSKRDRTNILQSKKVDSRNMLALVQKLKHLESSYQQKESEIGGSPITPSSVLPNIAEYTQPSTLARFTNRSNSLPEYAHQQRSVKYIRHPLQWTLEDIEPRANNANSESNGESHDPLQQFNSTTETPTLHRFHSGEEQLPIELFGSVKSTVCSVM